MKMERDIIWIAISFVFLAIAACVTPQSTEVVPTKLVVTSDSFAEDLVGNVIVEFSKYSEIKIEKRDTQEDLSRSAGEFGVLSGKADCYSTRTKELSRVSYCDQTLKIVDPVSGRALVAAQQRAIGDADHLPSWGPLVDKIYEKVKDWKGRLPASDESDANSNTQKAIDRLDRNSTTPVKRTNY